MIPELILLKNAYDLAKPWCDTFSKISSPHSITVKFPFLIFVTLELVLCNASKASNSH